MIAVDPRTYLRTWSHPEQDDTPFDVPAVIDAAGRIWWCVPVTTAGQPDVCGLLWQERGGTVRLYWSDLVEYCGRVSEIDEEARGG